MHRPLAMIFCVLAAAAGSAHAVRVKGEPAPTAAAVAEANLSTTSTSDAAAVSSLTEGVITDVSPDGDKVQIQGVWLKVIPEQTRIFLRGTSISAKQLTKNSKVKFTLSSDRSALGVVYAP